MKIMLAAALAAWLHYGGRRKAAAEFKIATADKRGENLRALAVIGSRYCLAA